MKKTFSIDIQGAPVLVHVERKQMKTIRLRVLSSGEVRLSVPPEATDAWIQKFLRDKQPWIAQKHSEMARRSILAATSTPESLQNGQTVPVLGREIPVRILAAPKRRSALSEGVLYLYTPEPENVQAAFVQQEKWRAQAASECYGAVIERLMPIFAPYQVRRPQVAVKRMKSLWGSCARSKGKLSLNLHLFRASMPCVEYVILHELTHFLYPKHDKDFYGFIANYMPDWEARRKRLHEEVILR